MAAKIPPSIAQKLDEKFCPSLKIPAVALCARLWANTIRATLDRTENLRTAERLANDLYRASMPPLSGHQNISDFIACAGYGMLVGAIKPEDGTRLLYAAQVALAALPKESRIRPKNHPRPVSEPSKTAT